MIRSFQEIRRFLGNQKFLENQEFKSYQESRSFQEIWSSRNLKFLEIGIFRNKRGTAKSGSSDRRCCKTAPNGRIDLKLSMEGCFGWQILVLVKWRSHGLCGGQTNILQFWPHLSTRNIFTYPIHDFYEVSVSKNAITSELEAIDQKK